MPKNLALRFTRYAWAKIVHINSLSACEVGAFGISNAKNPLLVEDIAVIKQEVTGAGVLFDDEAIADFFLDQVEAGRTPRQFGRIWIHTHPNWFTPAGPKADRIPAPSPTDEETFKRAFGNCDWSVMFIYGGGSSGYARLSLRKSFRAQIMLSIVKSNGKKPTEDDVKEWEQEFEENVTEEVIVIQPTVIGFGRAFTIPTQDYAFEQFLDTDIDADEFAQYVETFGRTLEEFCQLNEVGRQWWISEFRKDREVHPRNIITNPFL